MQSGVFNMNGLRLAANSIISTSTATGATYVQSGITSAFSLSINGYDLAAYQTEYTQGDLLYAGDNSAAFADVFSVTGNTLTVARVVKEVKGVQKFLRHHPRRFWGLME